MMEEGINNQVCENCITITKKTLDSSMTCCICWKSDDAWVICPKKNDCTIEIKMKS